MIYSLATMIFKMVIS